MGGSEEQLTCLKMLACKHGLPWTSLRSTQSSLRVAHNGIVHAQRFLEGAENKSEGESDVDSDGDSDGESAGDM